MDCQQIEYCQEAPVRRLEDACNDVKDIGGEVCLGSYKFNTKDSPELFYDNRAISIVKAKLERRGCKVDIEIRMTSRERSVIMVVVAPPIQLKAKAEKL